MLKKNPLPYLRNKLCCKLAFESMILVLLIECELCVAWKEETRENLVIWFFFLLDWIRSFTLVKVTSYTSQNIKFSIKEFFIKCDPIRRNLWIWSHLLQKSLKENFIFSAVIIKSLETFFILFWQKMSLQPS